MFEDWSDKEVLRRLQDTESQIKQLKKDLVNLREENEKQSHWGNRWTSARLVDLQPACNAMIIHRVVVMVPMSNMFVRFIVLNQQKNSASF